MVVFDDFVSALLHGIAPFIAIAIVNFLAATLIAWFAGEDATDAQLLGVAFGGIGAAVGLFMGASRDSVVGTVVPALLTLLSSVAVYQFGADAYRRWRPVLPIALFCLVLGAVGAGAFGASERERSIDRSHEYDEWRVQYEKLQIPLQLKKLERDLGLLPDPRRDCVDCPG
jgi:hypothetical protein